MTQNRSSAVMQQRSEPHDSLDDFPTPFWATRALIVATHERIVGKSHHSKFKTSDVYRATAGAKGGTWAHPILAAP